MSLDEQQFSHTLFSTLHNEKILITGGTGTLGEALAEKLLTYAGDGISELRILNRTEEQQTSMRDRWKESEYYDKLRFMSGNICNYIDVEEAVRGIKVVFHTAALKHVSICEQHPRRAFESNVMGSHNILRAILNNRSLDEEKYVIGASTDKACKPKNIYGMAKFGMERLFQTFQQVSDDVYFSVIRGGNFLGSTGSVIPRWVEDIKAGRRPVINDPDATRFWVLPEEIADLMLWNVSRGLQGAVVARTMVSSNLEDLFMALSNAWESHYAVPEYGIGNLGPAEKPDEELFSDEELKTVSVEDYSLSVPEYAQGKDMKVYYSSPQTDQSQHRTGPPRLPNTSKEPDFMIQGWKALVPLLSNLPSDIFPRESLSL